MLTGWERRAYGDGNPSIHSSLHHIIHNSFQFIHSHAFCLFFHSAAQTSALGRRWWYVSRERVEAEVHVGESNKALKDINQNCATLYVWCTCGCVPNWKHISSAVSPVIRLPCLHWGCVYMTPRCLSWHADIYDIKCHLCYAIPIKSPKGSCHVANDVQCFLRWSAHFIVFGETVYNFGV